MVGAAAYLATVRGGGTAIVETLKEFKGMLWGQPIKAFTDQKSHERCSRLNLRPSVPMKVTARRVRARDCLY